MPDSAFIKKEGRKEARKKEKETLYSPERYFRLGLTICCEVLHIKMGGGQVGDGIISAPTEINKIISLGSSKIISGEDPSEPSQ